MKSENAIRIGMLTPSSNTVLEPLTTAMLKHIPDVTVHYSRFRVTEIALSETAMRQFDDSEVLRAAELLADANVDVIAWNGTSASWLGFDRDERLCERILENTGIRACTSVLAFREIFALTGARNIGLVTPYTDDVQRRIMATWQSHGLNCVAERHSRLQDNFSFANVDPETIVTMAREVIAEAPCEAIAIVCTNMRGAPIVQSLEDEFGIPVYDSVATTTWKCLALTGIDPGRISGWGSVFQLASIGTPPSRNQS